MATRPATVRQCVNCGYDRTGLSGVAGQPTPCPECGRIAAEVEWLGWSRVLWIGTVGPTTAFGFGVLPPLAMAPMLTADGSTPAMYLLLPWLSIGACMTAFLLVFMPVIAAVSSSFHWWPRLGRPGYVLVWTSSVLLAFAGIAGLSLALWSMHQVHTR